MKNIIIIILALFSIVGYSQTVTEYVEEAISYPNFEEYKIKQIEAWDNAIKSDTLNCAWLYYMRAIAKNSHDKVGAIKDYLKSMESNKDCEIEYQVGDEFWTGGIVPDDNELYLKIARIQILIEEYKNAMINLNLIIKSGNKKILYEVYFERGKLKALLKDHRGAITDFDLVLKYNPKVTAIFSLRGDSKFFLKDYLGAINDYTKRIQLYPFDSAIEFYNRGLVKLALKHKESGCKDLSIAGEQGFSEAYEMIEKYCN